VSGTPAAPGRAGASWISGAHAGRGGRDDVNALKVTALAGKRVTFTPDAGSMAGSDALDFSFLSQEAAGPAVPPPAGAVAGAAATAAAAAAPHAPVSVSLAARSQPDGLHTVPDSWTLWDSNRQGQHRGGGAGGAAAHHGGAHQPAGAGAEPAAAGGTSFTRAFAHMKERPGYEPPPARAQQQPAAQAGGQSARPGGAAAAAHARTIQVSRRQTNNPVLRCIRNVPWEYAEIAADYQLGSQTCCLFLSLRYHLLKPKYIYTRMEALQRGFRLRVLLCMVDTEDNTKTLIDVHKVTVVNGWTLILAWSPEEAARYLETYQVFPCRRLPYRYLPGPFAALASPPAPLQPLAFQLARARKQPACAQCMAQVRGARLGESGQCT